MVSQPVRHASASPGPWPSAATWLPEHLQSLAHGAGHFAPLIEASDFARVSADLDIWDAWPVQDDGGTPFVLAGGMTLWMALASPRFDDPDERHAHARIHLLSHQDGAWCDLGPAMPDGFSPGSREWSGSAVLDADQTRLTLYFTAAGRRGEQNVTFEQRLFRAHARLAPTPSGYRLEDWRGLQEFVERDAALYMAGDEGGGMVGTIKAFRDPAYFRDPKDGSAYVFFAGSKAGSASAFNGVVGAAKATFDEASPWRLLAPLVSADGLNNELERPHVVVHGGLYYLFWSTQTHVFNPAGPMGPTGLYGMVAESLAGPWRPLNGSGLVFSNPPLAPRQAYSWFVMPNLQVTSFVDDWGQGERGSRPKRFGATFAPMLQLRLSGDIACLEV